MPCMIGVHIFTLSHIHILKEGVYPALYQKYIWSLGVNELLERELRVRLKVPSFRGSDADIQPIQRAAMERVFSHLCFFPGMARSLVPTQSLDNGFKGVASYLQCAV